MDVHLCACICVVVHTSGCSVVSLYLHASGCRGFCVCARAWCRMASCAVCAVRAVYVVRAVLKPQLAVASLLMFRQMREAFNDDELLSRFDIEEAMAEVTR